MKNPVTNVDPAQDIFILRWKDVNETRPAPTAQTWPRADGSALDATNPFNWYFLRFDEAPILSGPQYEAIQGDESSMEFFPFDNPPIGHPAGEAKKPWVVQLRTKEDQIFDLNRVAAAVLDAYYPPSDFPARNAKAMSALMAKSAGLDLSVEQENTLQKEEAFASIVLLTEKRKKEILNAIEDQTPYDMFDGWQLPREVVAGFFQLALAEE